MTDKRRPSNASNPSVVRRAGRAILIALAVLIANTAVAVFISSVLMSVFDSTEQWQAWRTDNYWLLLCWRLMLYMAITYAWLKLKYRLPQSDRTKHRRSILKIEVMLMILVLMIELSKAVSLAGGVQ
jgi:succinate dehydrogenase hydrophobic anchor subunit